MNAPFSPTAMKVIKIGNSLGVVIPRESLQHLRVSQGDTIYLTEAPDGSMRLTPFKPDFETKMALAEKIMRADRDILHVLAQ